MTYDDLQSQWEYRRDVLLDCGNDIAAKMIDKFLADLNKVLAMRSEEIFTISQASLICGFSPGH